MKDVIFTIVNTVLVNSDLKKVESIDAEMNLRDDLGLDSIALAELTVRIDEKFGIDIFDNDSIETIGDIYNVLEKK